MNITRLLGYNQPGRLTSTKSFKDREKQFHRYGAIRSGISHLVAAALFLFAGVSEMVYFNLFFSLPVITISYLLGKNNRLVIAWGLFYAEIIIHSIAAIYFIGLESGFQFYLLALAIVTHIAYGWKKWVRWSLFSLNLSIFILLHILLKDVSIYNLDATLLTFLFSLNLILSAFLSAIQVNYLLKRMIRFENDQKKLLVQLQQKNSFISDQKDEIEAQRDLVSDQKKELELVYNEVSSSISYATKIQESVLPLRSDLTEAISDHFILFFPKDKVSGDFYWWTSVKDHTIIAVADCTGHGVPGAFMSMLALSYLQEIVHKGMQTQPDQILQKLRNEIVRGLKQKGKSGEQKDGLDIALISIDHKKEIVKYAGANNPIYVIPSEGSNSEISQEKAYNINGSERTLFEYKADKMPIGIFPNMSAFCLKEFKVSKGDLLYLFSDGFSDQFGGELGKKFRYPQFRELLLKNCEKSLKDQKTSIENTFFSWKGELEQVDDVLLMGIMI